MNRFLVGLFLLPMISACASGGLSTPATRNQTVQSQGESFQTAKSLSTLPGTNDKLYVGNQGNSSITVYNHAASGNAAPLYTIAGPQTHISYPGQLSEDAQGNLYVTSNGNLNNEPASILVFAPGARGNIAPIRMISGPNTNVVFPEAEIVDRVTGKLFVYDEGGTEGQSRLIRFPPNANGNVTPFATSPYQLQPANQLANDSTGLRLIVAYNRTKYEPMSATGVISETKQFADGSIPISAYPVSAFDSRGVASDTNTKTYLVSTGEGIYRLAETTTGAYPSLSPAPISVINDICASQLVTAPGPNANTYAVHPGYYTGPGCSTAAVYVYANNANGNAFPLRILSGPATQLNQPGGVFEGP